MRFYSFVLFLNQKEKKKRVFNETCNFYVIFALNIQIEELYND